MGHTPSMQIEFHGAAREVTGSCHIVRLGGRTILLDCGLFQGRRADTQVKNARLPVEAGQIDAVVLSHAHIDHAGRLPLLTRRGYRNAIHTTAATRDLCAVMLADAAHIQSKDAEFLARRKRAHAEPLYSASDVARTMELMRSEPYAAAFDVVPGVRATFVEAGHILGSATVVLDCTERGATRRLVFSGDIGRAGLPIIRDPAPPARAQTVIMESTYGNRDHASVQDATAELGRIVREAAARGGRVLIPAFAVGRTQELVYDLHRLVDDGAIPQLPIVIDSPLASEATRAFERHAELYDPAEPFVHAHDGKNDHLFRFPLLRHTESVEESKALNAQLGPMVVIAASGMAESG
ncbi:MAG TPA: MBL fold metallo-hydrolase, partial [Gemmatimonadaceae bacterium]